VVSATKDNQKDRCFNCLTKLSRKIKSIQWVVRLSWLENAYWRPHFSVGDVDPKSRSDSPGFWHAIKVH